MFSRGCREGAGRGSPWMSVGQTHSFGSGCVLSSAATAGDRRFEWAAALVASEGDDHERTAAHDVVDRRAFEFSVG